jgi:transglutaminase-like putative cysteine protease
MILLLNVHYSRASDLRRSPTTSSPTRPYAIHASTATASATGARRIVAPPGLHRRSRATAIINDSGKFEVPAVPARAATPDRGASGGGAGISARRAATAILRTSTRSPGTLFAQHAAGLGDRVQAICDYVHNHISFGYQYARLHPHRLGRHSTSSRGVCRDFAHLAVDVLPLHEHSGALLHRLPWRHRRAASRMSPMDFAAWFEAYVGGRWCTFDPRNNTPRIGRVLLARGRDAIDVAISDNVSVAIHSWASRYVTDDEVK